MIARLRGIFLCAFWFTAIALIAPPIIGLFLLTKKEDVIFKPIRFFVKMGLFLVGVKVNVTGLEKLDPKQPYILTPNHQSFIEVPLFVTYLDRYPGYLAKKEVLFILRGKGRMWAGKSSTPIEPGYSIYLPKGQIHCVENTGEGELRLLGVFFPAGSPAVRYDAG